MRIFIGEEFEIMENKSLVTIVVPVYNVEEYLDRCVQSIVTQTYSNLEIILVDDGSPDRCGEMCDDWAQKDNRILVFHKDNGGLSDARNYGIKRAHGEYISFIDSDDWVTKYYIQHLVDAIEKDNADLAMCWYKKVSKFEELNINDSSLIKYKYLLTEGCLGDLLYQKKTDTCAWGKLYSNRLFSILNYPVGKLYEDIPVTYAAILASKRIARIENEDYYYFQRNNSIQHMEFNKQKLDAIRHIKAMTDEIQINYPALKKACVCRYFSVLNNMLFQIGNTEDSSELISYLWNEIKKYRKVILFDRNARKKARIAAAISYGGYKFMLKMYNQFNY